MTHEPLLQARALCKRYGARVVLDDCSLDVGAGESIALVGPSGCGKTTLLHLLAGLDSANAGSIRYRFDDAWTEFASASDDVRTRLRRRRFGFVFQFYNLVPTLDVAANVTLPRRLNRLPTSGDAAALERLHALGVQDRLHAWPAELSGGEQQRVAIARALSHAPLLLFADEPTGNLNVRQADEVMELLLAHAGNAGAALIYATHSERLAARASRVLDLTAPAAPVHP